MQNWMHWKNTFAVIKLPSFLALCNVKPPFVQHTCICRGDRERDAIAENGCLKVSPEG